MTLAQTSLFATMAQRRFCNGIGIPEHSETQYACRRCGRRPSTKSLRGCESSGWKALSASATVRITKQVSDPRLDQASH